MARCARLAYSPPAAQLRSVRRHCVKPSLNLHVSRIRSGPWWWLCLLALSSGCGAPFVRISDPSALTPAARCGVAAEAAVSRRQALCIAKAHGLPRGMELWFTKRGRNSWRVFSTIEADTAEHRYWARVVLVIDSRTGDVVDTLHLEYLVN